MKRFWTIGMSVLLSGAAAFAQAQATSELKIAVVNFQRLVTESPQGKAASESLRTEFLPKQRDLVQLGAQLKAKQEKLEKDAATMSPDQRTKAEKELSEGNKEFSRKQSDLQEEFNARQNEELSKLEGQMVNETRTYAQGQKLDLVLANNSVIYATNVLDITGAVLGYLQAKATPAAPATPPAAAPPGK